ncbi:MAG: sulfite exporter TauE/SafE family protein [Deltaproteobacteria bacterium]|nr:sulfite exporter TauE/SafE family protein [Deltaproteobacteria bacterium]
MPLSAALAQEGGEGGGNNAAEAQANAEAIAAAQKAAAPYLTPGMAGKVKSAIEKSFLKPETAAQTVEVIEKDKAKRGERPGFLGIPGAPEIAWYWGFLWAIWVGWIFSTVGAFGGVMAGVGHISIFGLGNYAKSFGKENPINKMVTDSIRVSNQWLVGLSAFISAINYYRMGRLVLPLGVCLAIGSVAGSYLIPELTAGKVSLKAYQGYFGLCVLVLGCFLLYQISPKGAASQKKAKEAAKEFEKARTAGEAADRGVKVIEGSYGGMFLALAITVLGPLWASVAHKAFPDLAWIAIVLAAAGVIMGFVVTAAKTVRFTFYGVEFDFKGYLPIVGGLFIAALASFLGVGGGFLFVPFLTSVAGLPMFLVAGTSGLAVLVGMIVSIFTYMVSKGVAVEWGFIAMELVGIFVGSMIGPRTSKFIPDKGLKIIFIVLAFYVGLRYALKGFAPQFWPLP